MKPISEDTLIWAGIWLILNHFVCSWGWLWLPGNLFPLLVGSWGDSVGVQGLHSPMLPLLWSLNELPWLFASRFCDPKDQSTKWKAYCALLGLRWGRETQERVFMLLDLWEQLLGRWMKAWGEIMLLGLLCSSWEGQTAFPSLSTGADCSELPCCSGSVLRGADFWGADGAPHLPEGGISGFNFVGIHPSLHASYSGPNCCTLLRYRFAYEVQCFICFPKTEQNRERGWPIYIPLKKQKDEFHQSRPLQ